MAIRTRPSGTETIPLGRVGPHPCPPSRTCHGLVVQGTPHGSRKAASASRGSNNLKSPSLSYCPSYSARQSKGPGPPLNYTAVIFVSPKPRAPTSQRCPATRGREHHKPGSRSCSGRCEMTKCGVKVQQQCWLRVGGAPSKT